MHRIATLLMFVSTLTTTPAIADRAPRYPQTYRQFPQPSADGARDDDHDRPDLDRYDAWGYGRERRPGPWHSLVDHASAREGVTQVRVPPDLQLARIRVEGTSGAPVVT